MFTTEEKRSADALLCRLTNEAWRKRKEHPKIDIFERDGKFYVRGDVTASCLSFFALERLLVSL